MARNIIDRTPFLFEYNHYIAEAEGDPETSPTPPMEGEEGMEGEEDLTGGDEQIPADDTGMEGMEGMEEPESDTEEIDITQLVDKQTEIISKLDELVGSLTGMSDKMDGVTEKVNGSLSKISDLFNDNVGKKIDALEKTVVTRNPTPDEQLSLKSLDSYPYNVKVSSYFEDYAQNKETARNNINSNNQQQNQEEEPKEFVITKKDIQAASDFDIKNSF